MNTYIHSVSLDPNKCTGCTTCMKHCPTEAIRVRGGCAEIDSERCIDCGACIRKCTHGAKKSSFNSLEEMNRFKYKIALPAPSLFAQLYGALPQAPLRGMMPLRTLTQRKNSSIISRYRL